MKKLMIIAALALMGCTHNETAEKWISEHKKPIVCIKYTTNMINYHIDYTLIDSTGCVYGTGDLSLLLPDTIK